MLTRIISICALVMMVTGMITHVVHVCFVCPLMERRALKRRDFKEWDRWLVDGDKRLYYRLAVLGMLVGGIVLWITDLPFL